MQAAKNVSGENSRTRGTLLPLLPKGRVDNVLYRAQIALRNEEISKSELRINLESLCGKNREVIFPSHFFAYEHRDLCLNWLIEMQIPFSLQISPGAELLEYHSTILEIKKRTGALLQHIEIVMDRAPHPIDHELLRSFSKEDIQPRYVFCPVIEINALEVMRLIPKSFYQNLFLYFPRKLNRHDSFYSADEIFIFLSKIKEQIPSYTPQVLEHLSLAETLSEIEEQNPLTRLRQTLDTDVYIRDFPSLGYNRMLRTGVIGLAKNFFTAPLLLLPYLTIWLLHDPRAMFGMCKRFILYPLRVFILRTVDITKHIIYAFWHFIYYIVLHSALLWMVKLYHLLRFILIIAFNAICHPIFFTKRHFPIMYWIIFFPALKIYWFLKFQFKKRVLKTPYEGI